MKYLYHGFRLGLAMFFGYAAVGKLTEWDDFVKTISAYGIVYESTLPLVAAALIVAELIGSIGLILNKKAGIIWVVVLLALFVVILGYGLWLGLDIDCGCLGVRARWLGNGLWFALIRNLILIGGCVFLLRYRSSRKEIRKQES